MSEKTPTNPPMVDACRFCTAKGARHYLGGGIWVCFLCFLRTVT